MKDSPDSPWTASRCLRLLRPAQTRLATLRKLATPEPFSSTTAPTAAMRPRGKTATTYSSRKRKRTTAVDDVASLAPPPTTPKPKPTRRDPFRCHHRRVPLTPSNANANAPHFSTPMLRKLCQTPPAPPPPSAKQQQQQQQETLEAARRLAGASAGTTTGELATAKAMHALKLKTPPQHLCVYEGLLQWLDSLLRVTAPTAADKSLMAMCLRRVPEYITQYEQSQTRVAEFDSTEPAAHVAIYGELEGLCKKHLGVLVRAHGVWMLVQAVHEGLLSHEFTMVLARHCLGVVANAEREGVQLLQALLLLQQQSQTTTTTTTTTTTRLKVEQQQVEGVLQPYNDVMEAGQYRSGAAVFAGLTTGLRVGRVQAAAALCGFGGVWAATAREVAYAGGTVAALEFASQAVMGLAAGASGSSGSGVSSSSSRSRSKSGDGCERGIMTKNPQQSSERVDQTLFKVLAALAAAAVVQDERWQQRQQKRQQPTVVMTNVTKSSASRRRVVGVLARSLAGLNAGEPANMVGRYAVALTLFLVLTSSSSSVLPSGGSEVGETAVLQEAQQVIVEGSCALAQNVREVSMAVVCGMAHYCGRASGRAAHGYLERFCRRLAGGEEEEDAMLGDGAFVLAQRTHDIRDLGFAEGQQRRQSGWRWEAGISEWIESSPGFSSSRHETELNRQQQQQQRRKRRQLVVGRQLQLQLQKQSQQQGVGEEDELC